MAFRWIAASTCLAATACGRLGYDGLASDGDGGPRPDAARQLDGGLGQVAPFPTDEVRLTYARGASLHPVAVWSGDALYVVWDDRRDGNQDLYLARLTASGDGERRNVRLTDDSAAAGFPAAAWAGDRIAVAWEDNRGGDSDVYARVFDAAGDPLRGEVAITTGAANSYDPSIAWNGTECTIAFHEGDETRTSVWSRQMRDGIAAGRSVLQSNGPALSQFTSLVWADGEYGLAWQDTRDGAPSAYFARVGAVVNEARATSRDSRVNLPVLAWADGEYGMAWADARRGDPVITFTRLDALGRRIGDEIEVSTEDEASTAALVWTGSGYGAAWSEDNAIFVAVLDAAGQRVADPIRVSDAGSEATEPSLVWMDGQFGVAWQDTRHGESEIYVRVVDR